MFELQKKFWSDFFNRLLGKKEPQVNPPVVTVPPPIAPKTVKSYYGEFDPQDTLPDSLFGAFDENLDIQGFFKSKNSYLATYMVNGRNVQQIINDACRPYSVNQKYIMVLLQKEQGAWGVSDISTIKPHTVLTRYKDANGQYVKNSDGTFSRKEFVVHPVEWCLGFGVPDDDPPNPKFQGFENQIVSCAKRIRFLFDAGSKQIGNKFQTLGYTVLTEALAVGRTKWEVSQMAITKQEQIDYVNKYNLSVSIDAEKYATIVMKNQWAYLLFMYTPWIHATYLTWKLWRQEWSEDLNVARNS